MVYTNVLRKDEQGKGAMADCINTNVQYDTLGQDLYGAGKRKIYDYTGRKSRSRCGGVVACQSGGLHDDVASVTSHHGTL